jgi:hypothetical protein
MPSIMGVQRRKDSEVHLPGWFYRGKSGLIIVPESFPDRLAPGQLEKIRRAPQVLQLAPDTAADIIDLIRREEINLSTYGTIVTHLPAHDTLAFSADVGFILSKLEKSVQVVLFSPVEPSPDVLERIPVRRLRRSYLRRTHVVQHEGSIFMAGSHDGYIENPEELKEKLQELVRRIHEEEDPHEMNEYKKFIKKNVSVFSRSYFTAYLVKQFIDGNTERRPPRKIRSKKEETVTGNVAPEDRQTLFVSVGKNRRVYPKDFVALFAELDGVEGDDIGQIKILDNYSFVEVEQTVADKIIAAYDGYDFRGRKLTVNFARNKKD